MSDTPTDAAPLPGGLQEIADDFAAAAQDELLELLLDGVLAQMSQGASAAKIHAALDTVEHTLRDTAAR